uniref:Checkpoint kinase 2 n=1 Tax=Amphiprion percula TaxID=161767 RepID=A0A3P8U7Y9_AMPPE
MTVWRTSICSDGTPSVTTSWTTLMTEDPRSSESTARNTSGSSERARRSLWRTTVIMGRLLTGFQSVKIRSFLWSTTLSSHWPEQRNRVFVFIDLMSDDQSSLPRELREKYLLTRRIGTGVCGEVRLAFQRSTCRKVAVKIINKKNFQSEGMATRNATTEIEILQRVDHPCLIKTEDFYQTDDSYYIVLELMEGGELFHRVKSQQQLQENVAKLYFYQMLSAVQYLHSNGIIHRDLKPENILLSSQEDVCLIKVTDFNQSRILEESVLMRTLCGTPSYLAPEVFTQASTTGYSLAVDAWSLGVLLFVCLGGYPPFHESFGDKSVTDQIILGEFTMVPSKWRHVSDQAKDVVRRLLVVDPSKRMSIEAALQHAWLQDQGMLETAHRLMYPPGEDAAAVSMQEAPSGGPSKRKRGDGDEEDQHPASGAKPRPPAACRGPIRLCC